MYISALKDLFWVVEKSHIDLNQESREDGLRYFFLFVCSESLLPIDIDVLEHCHEADKYPLNQHLGVSFL